MLVLLSADTLPPLPWLCYPPRYLTRYLCELIYCHDSAVFTLVNFWGAKMSAVRIFHPVHILVVTRNQRIIILHKIKLFLNLVKCTSKSSKILTIPYRTYFFCSFNGFWVFSKFVIFHQIKIVKHIQDRCCRLVAENGSWFILILRFNSATPTCFGHFWQEDTNSMDSIYVASPKVAKASKGDLITS